MALVMNPNVVQRVNVVQKRCSVMSEDSMDMSEEEEEDDEECESLSPGSNRNSVFTSVPHMIHLEVILFLFFND